MSEKTLKELREEIAQEREWTTLHKKSIEHWKTIIDEMEDEKEALRDIEWKTRYNYQVVCNASLEKQIKKLKTEVNSVRNGVALAQVCGDLDQKSINECRQHVKHLKNKLLSLRGLCTSYEHQRDVESTEYLKTREQIQSIAHDVRFKQTSKVAKQEKQDQYLPPINVRPRQAKASSARHKKPVTLPPINPNPQQQKPSYLLMHEETKTKKTTKNTPQKKVHFLFGKDYIDSV